MPHYCTDEVTETHSPLNQAVPKVTLFIPTLYIIYCLLSTVIIFFLAKIEVI